MWKKAITSVLSSDLDNALTDFYTNVRHTPFFVPSPSDHNHDHRNTDSSTNTVGSPVLCGSECAERCCCGVHSSTKTFTCRYTTAMPAAFGFTEGTPEAIVHDWTLNVECTKDLCTL